MYKVLKTVYTGKINVSESGTRNLKILGFLLENMETGVTCIVSSQEAYDISQESGIVNAEGRIGKIAGDIKNFLNLVEDMVNHAKNNDLTDEKMVVRPPKDHVGKGYIVDKEGAVSLIADEFLIKLDKSVVETYNTSEGFKEKLVDMHGRSRI